MIKGFESETAELNYEEKKLLTRFVERLKLRIGKEKSVTSSQIIKGFKDHLGIKISGARVRKIINHIRMHDLVPRLIATSKGYYVTNDKQELKDYTDSLKGREEAIKAIRLKTEKYL